VLVTNAGQETIAEATSVGLPVMLTKQEEGNMEVVDYYDQPLVIPLTVMDWLADPPARSRTPRAFPRCDALPLRADMPTLSPIPLSALGTG